MTRTFKGKLRAPPAWFAKANPYLLVFAPYVNPGKVGVRDYALFAGAVLLISAALVVVVIARLRRVVIGGLGRPQHPARWRLPELKRQFCARFVAGIAGIFVCGNRGRRPQMD